jgi:hypothetical protein
MHYIYPPLSLLDVRAGTRLVIGYSVDTLECDTLSGFGFGE